MRLHPLVHALLVVGLAACSAATSGTVPGASTDASTPPGNDGAVAQHDASGVVAADAGADTASNAVDSGDDGGPEMGVDAAVEASIPCTAPLDSNEECRNGLPAPIFEMLPAGWSMDITEITRSQYAAWLATSPSTANQPAECTGKTSYTPDATCMKSSLVCTTDCDAHPQVCVDWCDAQTYCQALGKQLCGARPDAIAQGETVTFADWANAELDQFEYACSADGKQDYVYADTYDATACNTGCTGAACKTVVVASKSTCQGEPLSAAFPGVFDLDGNVAEWDGVCASDDPAAQCHVRGGDMQATATTSTCDYGTGVALVARNAPQPTVGFRCCSSM